MFENNEETYGAPPENDEGKSKRFDQKEWDANQAREGPDLHELLSGDSLQKGFKVNPYMAD